MEVLKGMQGLGDSIYSRPFLKAANDRGETVYIHHSWPQLIADLPHIKPVDPGTRLRTQRKNSLDVRGMYHQVPRGARVVPWHYVSRPNESILQALEHGMPLKGQPLVMDLPDFRNLAMARASWTRPYVLVRPCTIRREWRADNRNPLPEYVAGVAEVLRADYDIVVVADLQPGHEWAEAPMPVGDQEYLRGELKLPGLMALAQGAAALVGPVGWILPAAMAMRKPAFIIMGGQGGHNAPERLLDPRVPTPQIHLAMPANFCRCSASTHQCDRRIPDLGEQLEAWRLAAGI